MIWTINLLNNILVCLLLTSLTGGVLVVIWLGIGRILEKLGFINIVYELLKMVILFFFVPLSYLCLKMFEGKIGKGFLFTPISGIEADVALILGAWGFLVVVALIGLGYEIYKLNRYFRDAIPAKKSERKILETICEELHISPDKVELKYSYRVEIPCVMGIRRAKVVLPVENYEEETLRVVLTHELTHFRQKDLILKRISLVVLIFHFFNPFAWLLYEKIQEWSEYACDYRSYPRCGGIGRYFNVLIDVAMGEDCKGSFSSRLYEDRRELEERIKKMKSVHKMKKRAKLSVVLVMCLAFMGSSLTVYATTMQTAKAYEYLYRSMELETSTDMGELESDYVEYTESGDAPGITLIEMPVNVNARASYGFTWEVDGRCRVSAPYYSLTAGQKVAVTASMVPVNVEVKVGLENAEGTRRYVVGSDVVQYTFEIETDGYYRVYIQNDSYTDVTVDGTYLITGN